MQIAQAARAQRGRGVVLEQAGHEITDLKVISGLEPAVGPGVIVRVSDPESVFLAQDLVSLVNELQAGGA